MAIASLIGKVARGDHEAPESVETWSSPVFTTPNTVIDSAGPAVTPTKSTRVATDTTDRVTAAPPA
jgi:hypothetical protein